MAMTAVVISHSRKPALTRTWDAGLCTHAEVGQHRISLATGKPQKTTPVLVTSPNTKLPFLALANCQPAFTPPCLRLNGHSFASWRSSNAET